MKDTDDSRFQFLHPVLILCKILFVVFLCSTISHADVLTLAWDPPSQDPDLVYNLCYGTNSQSYTTCVEAGNQTSCNR